MPTQLSIIVYVASPIDYARYRHTALFLEHPSTSHAAQHPPSPSTTTTTTTLLEITGGNGFFRFHETPNYKLPSLTAPPPRPPVAESTTPQSIISSVGGGGGEIARVIALPVIEDSISVSAVRTAIVCTPINNSGLDWMDWNCQNWVGDVLGRMVKRGMITEADREEGIERMVEGVLEAKDEWLNE